MPWKQMLAWVTGQVDDALCQKLEFVLEESGLCPSTGWHKSKLQCMNSIIARGRLGGRKPIPVDDSRVQTAKKMHANKSLSITDICQTLNTCQAKVGRKGAVVVG